MKVNKKERDKIFLDIFNQRYPFALTGERKLRNIKLSGIVYNVIGEKDFYEWKIVSAKAQDIVKQTENV